MKILLVQTSFLGDVVLSTPLIRALRLLYPQSELWLLTTPAARALVERDPEIAGVLTFDKRGSERGVGGLFRKAAELRAHGFSRVYSLHRSARTAVLLWLARIPERIGFHSSRLKFLYTRLETRLTGEHDVLRNLSLLTSEAPPQGFDAELRLFAPQPQELQGPARELALHGGYVALFPGSVWKTKRWQWQGFRDVAKHFLALGTRVVVLGSPEEREVAERVSEGLAVDNRAGEAGIAEAMALVQHAALVVCNDSMALHLASAFKRPTVTVFCATSPSFGFGPWRSPAKVVEVSGLACKPCRRHGSQSCPTGTEACMKLPAEQVLRAAGEVLPV